MTDPLPQTLVDHLRTWVGDWPPSAPLRVVANPRRAQPAWDGRIAPVAGVELPDGTAIVGLAPDRSAAVPDGLDVDGLLRDLPVLLGTDGLAVRGIFRWTTDPVGTHDLPDVGDWVPVSDPRVPPWLHPFGGEVLVAFEYDLYVAGVGIKKHDAYGHELAVVTEEAARGRGLARALVAQAARRVLDEGRVPTYLHAPTNLASAKVAEAAGFTDRGWHVLGFFPREQVDPDGQ